MQTQPQAKYVRFNILVYFSLFLFVSNSFKGVMLCFSTDFEQCLYLFTAFHRKLFYNLRQCAAGFSDRLLLKDAAVAARHSSAHRKNSTSWPITLDRRNWDLKNTGTQTSLISVKVRAYKPWKYNLNPKLSIIWPTVSHVSYSRLLCPIMMPYFQKSQFHHFCVVC